MESNIQTIRWIIQLKIKFTQRYMLPRLTLLLSYDMRKRQICKIINISSHSASLHIIGDSNFESELEWRIQSVNSNSLEIESKNFDRSVFKLKLWKTQLELQMFQQLCSMTSSYLGKMRVHFFCSCSS